MKPTPTHTTSSSASPPPSRRSSCSVCEQVGPERLRLFIDHPDGCRPRDLRAGHQPPARPARRLRARGLLARPAAPAHQARPFPALHRTSGPCAPARAARGTPHLHGRARGRIGRGSDRGRRGGSRFDSLRRHQSQQPAGGKGMTKEIVEAVGVLEREKGISADRLMAALEDALLSAYKKTQDAAQYARVEVDRGSGDFRVYELILPPDLEEQLLDEVEEEAGEPTVDPETGEMVYPEPPEIDQERLAAVPRPDRGARRHPGRLRPHRRPDRQAGDPAAHPRGGAGHDVQRVPGPGGRADHRHRPAVRLALHAGAAARARGSAASARGAGARRALRPRPAGQGDHHRRLEPGQGPVDHRLAPLTRADPRAVRARGAGDRRRPRGDRERGPRAGLPLEDRGGLARVGRRPGRRLRGPARLARAHGRVRAARREDRHHPLQRGAGPLRGEGALARRAYARCWWTTTPSRPP